MTFALKPAVWRRSALSLALALSFPLHAQAQSAANVPSNAELYKTIKELRTEIETLRAELDSTAGSAKGKDTASVESLKQRVNAQQAQIDALAQVAEAAPSKISGVHFGGYGEMHYNNLSADDQSNDVEEIDFHRFVLFTGYDFSDRIRFASELEVEHSIAADGAAGEVEIEQAYLEFDINSKLTARGGLMLIPAGIINETHEPPTFYGVERNDVESIIIPSTWWAGGGSLAVRFAPGLQLDLMLHEGLKIPTTGGDAFRVRSGRQKTSEAEASNLAGTTRLRYTGIPGLELAGSLQYQSDASQVSGDGLSSGLLYTAHGVWSHGPFALRALYGGWQFSGAAVKAADADKQTGWYLEPSYRVLPQLGVYGRYEDVEAARLQDRFSQFEGGLNYYPHPKIVLKADYRVREHDLASESGRDFDGLDLGLGYIF
jgi:hypothetical protein